MPELNSQVQQSLRTKLALGAANGLGLNAPNTLMTEWNSQVDNKLRMKLVQGAANEPV